MIRPGENLRYLRDLPFPDVMESANRVPPRSRAWRRGLQAVAVLMVAALLEAFWLEPAQLTLVEAQIVLGWPAARPPTDAVLSDLPSDVC